jgi:hypothetical protein
MSFIENFTATQYISAPNLIVFDDTSTGTDVAIAKRRVYMQKSDGTYLVVDGTTTDYEEWALANTTISYDVLDKDYALTITVEWLDALNIVLYSKTVDYCFSTYSKIYDVKLSKAQVSSPSLLDGDNWLSTKFALTTYIRAADDAISLGAGITIAQLSLNKAKFIIDNPKLVF